MASAKPIAAIGRGFVLPFSLHARPAALVVKLAQRYESDIVIECGPKFASAKSILSLLTLGADQGMDIRIIAKGEDATEALTAIGELLDILNEDAGHTLPRTELPPGTFLAHAG